MGGQNGNKGVGRLGIRKFQFGEGLHGVDANCGAVRFPLFFL